MIFTLSFLACGKKSAEHMVFVEGGSFYMGTNDQEGDPDEKERRLVSVNDFYISQYEVTQAEWADIMNQKPSCFQGGSLPVECISWDDAKLFINKLNKKTGRHYRLPTQEEWEYAARGGKFSTEVRNPNNDQLVNVGWTHENSGKKTHRVGVLTPNALGLYDMIGNVHEWCDGLYDSVFYAKDHEMSKKYKYEDVRVFKGGSWASDPKHCRISNINYNSRETKNFTIGFRLAENATK